jgi:hypothetical protein
VRIRWLVGDLVFEGDFVALYLLSHTSLLLSPRTPCKLCCCFSRLYLCFESFHLLPSLSLSRCLKFRWYEPLPHWSFNLTLTHWCGNGDRGRGKKAWILHGRRRSLCCLMPRGSSHQCCEVQIIIWRRGIGRRWRLWRSDVMRFMCVWWRCLYWCGASAYARVHRR